MAIDRQRLSSIAHRQHPVACPLGDAKVDQLIDQLALRRSARVLDIGCGTAEWLSRILERCPDAQATGIDTSPHALEAARRRTSSLASRLRLEEIDADRFLTGCSGELDLVICAGSTQALGGFAETLTRCRPLLADGGQLLVAEGFWQAPPSQGALAVLGVEPGALASLQDTVAATVEAGYAPQYVTVSNQDEWDHYEWCWCGELEAYARQNPDEPDVDSIVAAARAHRDGYLSGYRGVLGFAAMILRPE